MAIEAKRGCGYRKVGGYYLIGGAISIPCDRLPYPLDTCPVCGGGIKVTRGFTKINPLRLFGPHDQQVPTFDKEPERSAVNGPLYVTKRICTDQIRPCFMCDPTEAPAFIMGVGEKFYKTPGDFLEEANRLGISKRIPFIPKEMELGKTVVYLAHPRACEVRETVGIQQAMAILDGSEAKHPRLVDSEKVEKTLGIFTVFIPRRVEKLIWESQASPEELEKLEKRGITPVVIPDGDRDHS